MHPPQLATLPPTLCGCNPSGRAWVWHLRYAADHACNPSYKQGLGLVLRTFPSWPADPCQILQYCHACNPSYKVWVWSYSRYGSILASRSLPGLQYCDACNPSLDLSTFASWPADPCQDCNIAMLAILLLGPGFNFYTTRTISNNCTLQRVSCLSTRNEHFKNHASSHLRGALFLF
jgi:hypothetical protein